MTACSSGKYYFGVRGTSSANCVTCPIGYYCNNAANGNIVPAACPPNTYGAATGLTAVGSCTNCNPGAYCALPAISFSDRQFPCIPGYYCASGSAPATCATGTYSDSTSLLAAASCSTCPDGWMCSTAGTSTLRNPYIPCAKGYYCAAGVQTACPGGTFSNKDYLTASTQCAQCPAGYYCPSASILPIICPEGQFCLQSSSTYTNCPAGTYSPYEGVTNSGDCIQCPVGYYCTAGVQIPTQCTAGNYNPTAGSSSCTTCPAGFYCPLNG